MRLKNTFTTCEVNWMICTPTMLPMRRRPNYTLCSMLQRYIFIQDVADIQEWLYDEGEDASKNAYTAKMEELQSIGGPIRQRLLDEQEQKRQDELRIQQEHEAEEKRRREEAEAAKKAETEVNKPNEMQIDEPTEKADGSSKDEEMTDATALD